MSPLELIRKGIENGDWDAVCSGYSLMTGQQVQVPEPTEYVCSTHTEILKQIQELVNGALPYQINSDALEKLLEEGLAPSSLVMKPADYGPFGAETQEIEEKREEASPAHRTSFAEEQKPAGADDTEKFRVKNGKQKGRACKLLPFKPPTKNRFKDNLKVSVETIKESKTLSETKGGHVSDRDMFENIRLTCSRCQKEFEVHPSLRPRALEREDSEPVWYCDKCVSKPRGMSHGII